MQITLLLCVPGAGQGSRKPLFSLCTQQDSLIISLPLLLFLGDPVSLFNPLANRSAALLGPADRLVLQSPWGRGSSQSQLAGVAGYSSTRSGRTLEQGWPGRMGGFRLWCKSWWRSQEVHEKAIHGLAKEIRRNLIPA